MKYWAYLVLKLALIAAVVYGLLVVVLNVFPLPYLTPDQRRRGLFLESMPFRFGVIAVWLIGAGLLSWAIRDQKRRCRTCLRNLVMPVAGGSWSNMLQLGRPNTEWICPFGHGTLRIEEVQITGKAPPDWQPHGDDIWKELESYQQSRK